MRELVTFRHSDMQNCVDFKAPKEQQLEQYLSVLSKLKELCDKQVELLYAAEKLTKTAVKDGRSRINSAIHDLHRVGVRVNDLIGNTEKSDFHLEMYYADPSVHSAAGMLKKAEKLAKKSNVDLEGLEMKVIRPICELAAGYKDTFKELDQMAGKALEDRLAAQAARKENGVSAVYTSNKDDRQHVIVQARSMAQPCWESIKAYEERHIDMAIMHFEKIEDTSALSAEMKEFKKDLPWAKAYMGINKIFQYTMDGDYILHEDAQEMKEAEGKQFADMICDKFAYKQAAKLAPLLKHSPLKSLEGSASYRDGMLDARVKVALENGTSFDLNSQVVYGFSSGGNAFQRYPTTFHNVDLGDGKVHAMLSEEEMHQALNPEEDSPSLSR